MYISVNGNYSAWSMYSLCSKECNGMQRRTRTCIYPTPQNGGTDCLGLGEPEESKFCDKQLCTGNLLSHIITGRMVL